VQHQFTRAVLKNFNITSTILSVTGFILALACAPLAHAQTSGKAPANAPKKTFTLAFRAAETGFDPQKIEDRYSVGIAENIFESLLTYDWLARPARLAPQVVREVPIAEEDATRFTFRLKPGIYFQSDPVFKGVKRELIAKDVEYAIKRFRDPAVRSPYSWLFEDKVVGLDEFTDAAKKSGKFDYDAPIEGVKVIDRYTISFKLKAPDYNFIYFFAMPNVAPVAREVIEAYKDDTMAHPVGTGPFILKEWVRRSKIVLERNPDYRGHTLNTEFADKNDPWDVEAIKRLGGKTLPLLDRVVIYPIEEEQPRFLAFMNKEHDIMEETPFAYMTQVAINGKLSPTLSARNVSLFKDIQPEIAYTAFNMENAVIGGYKPENIALRRAIVMAQDRDQEINIVRRGQASVINSPIPLGVVGYDATFKAEEQEFNPEKASALLDMFGYKRGGTEGYRTRPDGSPLLLEFKYSSNESEKRQLAELWVKNLARVGLRMEAVAVQFADLLKDRKAGKYVISELAWIADYPDAQNFLQLLYGPNTDISNDARFKLAAYDKLYTQSLRLPDGVERNKIYREMNRLVVTYAPWRFGVQRNFTHLINPWVLGYKKHPIYFTSFRYLDIDTQLQQANMAQ
jgi:oligopeptide transport system substrate-binding protein